MSGSEALSASDFGASFKGFLQQMAASVPVEESVFCEKLRSHFQADPNTLPTLSQQFDPAEHPNFQTAVECYLAEGRSAELLGIGIRYEYSSISFAQLIAPINSGLNGKDAPTFGPVQYTTVLLQDEATKTCVQTGLYLVTAEHEQLALLVRGPSPSGFFNKVSVEVMAPEAAIAESFLSHIRRTMRQRNVYRGQVISLSESSRSGISVRFHKLPDVTRQNIILPEGLLSRIERQTLGFVRHTQKLAAAGIHLKRGILLYGPPGTGKTLTAMYLSRQMPERTVFLLTGQGLGLIEQSCEMARMLQPATIIVEDVDLIAEERTRQGKGANALLFELLNQMDGLGDDADVLFLLTTNRPESLEPALASRPGRIDQAIEVPPPDAECRRRLFELYSQGLTMRLENWQRFIDKTKGVSASFIRELLRKAALYAADEGEAMVVEDRHLEEALQELVVHGGDLTRSLLGAGKEIGFFRG